MSSRGMCGTRLALAVLSASLLAACDTTTPTADRTPESPAFDQGSAPGKPLRTPLPDAPFSFAAGVACSFPLVGTVVANNEVSNTFPAEPNGDVVTRITGRLVMTLTNGSTNKSIDVNISGPGTLVVHADGSADFIGYGNSLFIFTPTSIPAGPMTFIYSGRAEAHFPPSGQLILVSQSGNSQDVCAALS